MGEHSVSIKEQGDSLVLEVTPVAKRAKLISQITMPLGILALLLLFLFARQYLSGLTLLMIFFMLLFPAYSLLRNWLWLHFGKEVTIIQANDITYFLDFKTHKERKVKRPYYQLDILFRDPKKKTKKIQADLIDDDLILEESKSVILGYQIDEDEIIQTYLPVGMEEARALIEVKTRGDNKFV